MKTEKLIFHGGKCLTNKISQIVDGGDFFAQKNTMFKAAKIKRAGDYVNDSRRESNQIGLEGQIWIPHELSNFDRTLLDLKTEFDRVFNQKDRYLRYCWDYRIIDDCEDSAKWSGFLGAANTDFEINYNYFQWGKGSLEFDIQGGETDYVKNYGFEDYTGTPDDNSSDTFDYWSRVIGTNSYIDSNTTSKLFGIVCVKLHKGTGNCYLYQDIFLKENEFHVIDAFMKSDGTGVPKFKLKSLKTNKYLQDDGSWAESDNTISDLEGGTGDTRMIHRYFRFTTESDYTGLYRLYVLNDTNNSNIYIDNIRCRKSDETKIIMVGKQITVRDEENNVDVALTNFEDTDQVPEVLDIKRYDRYIYILWSGESNSLVYVTKFNKDFIKVWETQVNVTGVNSDYGKLLIDSDEYLWAFYDENNHGILCSKLSLDGNILVTETELTTQQHNYLDVEEFDNGNIYIVFRQASGVFADTDIRYIVVDRDDLSVSEAVSIIEDTDLRRPKMKIVNSLVYIFYTDDADVNDNLKMRIYDQNWSEVQGETVLIDEDEGVESRDYSVAFDSSGEFWVAYVKRISGIDSRWAYRKFSASGSDIISPVEVSASRVLDKVVCSVDELDNFFSMAQYFDSPYSRKYIGKKFNGDALIAETEIEQLDWYLYEIFATEFIPNEETAIIRGDGLQGADLTSFINSGSFGFVLDLPDIYNITSVRLKIGNDNLDYYESDDIEVNSENISFQTRENLIVFNWCDMTQVGSVNVSNMDYVEIWINYNDTLDEIENIRLDMVSWFNEDETRNYRVWLDSLNYTIKKKKLMNFNCNFLASEGYGFSTFKYSVLQEENISLPQIDRIIEFSGSGIPLPVFNFFFNNASGIDKLTLKNLTLDEGSVIEFSPDDNDTLTIDFNQLQVYHNLIQVPFSGLPSWVIGKNRIQMKFEGTASGVNDIKQEIYNVQHGSGFDLGETYLAQSFVPKISGIISSLEVYGLLYSVPIGETARIKIYTDVGGNPGVLYDTSDAVFGGVLGWRSITGLVKPLVEGVTYWMTLDTYLTGWGGAKVYLTWWANSAGGYADGIAKKSADSITWNTISGQDMTFRLTMSAISTANYNLLIEYSKIYY